MEDLQPNTNTMDTMVIFVSTSTGKKFPLTVKPEDTVKELKAKLFDRESIPRYRQLVIYNGKYLKDERTLASYNIQSEAVVYKRTRIMSLGVAMFSLNVITPSNKVIQTVVSGLTTIKELKEMLENEDQTLTPGSHCVMVANSAMEDNKTLGDYGIMSDSVIRIDKIIDKNEHPCKQM
ncbi:polyubiquitin-like [Penaeus japonicus]|uniref:polyubiquitin-like n=1 Tax=Penaeus japonicus TaxID=27405 RepID=UPI001C7146B5|nr:polyubiquitin-like [Penaeus japonicus]